jgi:hypothetical protein
MNYNKTYKKETVLLVVCTTLLHPIMYSVHNSKTLPCYGTWYEIWYKLTDGLEEVGSSEALQILPYCTVSLPRPQPPS